MLNPGKAMAPEQGGAGEQAGLEDSARELGKLEGMGASRCRGGKKRLLSPNLGD